MPALKADVPSYSDEDQARWREVGEQGEKAMRAKDWTRAVELFDNQIKVRPNWVNTYLYRAHCLAKLGQIEEAIAECQAGVAIAKEKQGAKEVQRACTILDKLQRKREPEYFKFPRTHHVLNTGGTAVTRDDLVMSNAEAAEFFDGRTVVIAEEKVDGSNLGFSLTKDYQVLAQNRSHFVNSQSHSQFKQLDAWIAENAQALCDLLEPEVEVLFGEWMYARHSIAYDQLPAYFIAFDIYNKRTRCFCSVRERNRRLEQVGIPSVRPLAQRTFNSAEELLALLDEQSAYYNGHVEGAYLRIDQPIEQDGGLWHVRRGKIVRSDFIQGIEQHWMTQTLVRNSIRYD